MQFWQTVYDLYRTEFEQNLNRIEEFLCLLFLVTYLKSSFFLDISSKPSIWSSIDLSSENPFNINHTYQLIIIGLGTAIKSSEEDLICSLFVGDLYVIYCLNWNKWPSWCEWWLGWAKWLLRSVEKGIPFDHLSSLGGFD